MGDDNLIVESGEPQESSSDEWWLNSGAKLIKSGDAWRTVHGELPASDRWRKLYLLNNPLDTDNGYHPQNLFRLISRKSYTEPRQEIYFFITRVVPSASPNRNESNGVLLLSKYKNADNLYYAGIRVDGRAVIKKKSQGVYTTLAEALIYDYKEYNRDVEQNLIPMGRWLGMRTETTEESATVTIRLYMDLSGTGEWREVLSVADPQGITGEAPVGLRTDFMEVGFTNYRIEEAN